MKERKIDTLSLDGSCLCLNFVNTVHSWTEEPAYNYLKSYADVLHWGVHVGMLSKKQELVLGAAAVAHPRQALRAYTDIIKARDDIHELFADIITGHPPSEGSLANFNVRLSNTLSLLRLDQHSHGMAEAWDEKQAGLTLPLAMVVRSVYEVLIHEPPARLKSCPSCGWLFLDTTKNNGRRWCSPLSCGSIDKASRYYYKKKKEAAKKA